jgi:hypothetical protein
MESSKSGTTSIETCGNCDNSGKVGACHDCRFCGEGFTNWKPRINPINAAGVAQKSVCEGCVAFGTPHKGCADCINGSMKLVSKPLNSVPRDVPSKCASPKIDLTQVPWLGVEAVAEVMQDPRGTEWLTSWSEEKTFKSLLRHALQVAIQGVRAIDPSDNKLHLAKLACRCLMILYQIKKEQQCTIAKDAI